MFYTKATLTSRSESSSTCVQCFDVNAHRTQPVKFLHSASDAHGGPMENGLHDVAGGGQVLRPGIRISLHGLQLLGAESPYCTGPRGSCVSGSASSMIHASLSWQSSSHI